MPLGPREKSELELHWQHQQDHVRADIKNIYRRMQNSAEREAFHVIAEEYQATGKLLDLTTDPAALENIARKALPEGS
jgi:hypothetical protein